MFRVGDTVASKVMFGLHGGGKVGHVGIVTMLHEDKYHVGVRWFNFKDGHDFDNLPGYPASTCWFLPKKDLKLYEMNLENK